MRVALLGRTHWLLAAGQAIKAAGHDIISVITAEAAPEYKATAADFAEFAQSSGASFADKKKLSESQLHDILLKTKPDVVVSMNWPSILGSTVCSVPTHGMLNAHPGDLPRYRGNACPNWAILRNEPRIGLTIHAMIPGEVDSGPIYARDYIENHSALYIDDVYEWLGQAVPSAFKQALSNLEDTGFTPEDQRSSGRVPLRCHPRRPDDALIDWHSSAQSIQRLVRASSRPFAGAFTWLEGKEKVTIWRARVEPVDHDILAVPGQLMGRTKDGAVMVACGEGVLGIEVADTANGKPLTASNAFRLCNKVIAAP